MAAKRIASSGVRRRALGLLSLLVLGASCRSPDAAMRSSLTFYASFDLGPDADYAAGDGRMHTAPDLESSESSPGLTRGHASIVAGEGRRGGTLRFTDNTKQIAFFPAEGNFAYREKGWSGSISLWLRVDPDKDLKPNWSDPILVTDKAWDNASIFLDFTKDDRPRHFRLGVFCDKPVWNADGRKYDEIPDAERPLVIVKETPFARDRWTHVVVTFREFNGEEGAASARLYLDGVDQGEISGRPQIFTWDTKKARILLGILYIGDLDELMIFDRELTPAEVALLGQAPELRF